jgi:hypothetical protein
MSIRTGETEVNSAEIIKFLPANFRLAAARPDGPTAALIAAMEALHEPDEQIIANFERYVSPWRAPDDFVMLQASWFGLDRYFDWTGGRAGAGQPIFAGGIANLRLLVAEAGDLMRRRGMASTLVRFLELATGTRGFTLKDGAPDNPVRAFHFTLSAPARLETLRKLVERIVEGERPAHASYTIVFEPAH